MNPFLRRARNRVHRMLGRDFVAYAGAVLPPPHMRYCGTAFRDDETFLESGRVEARRLKAEFGLTKDTAVLEIGCGPGRLPIGILAEEGDVARYDGVDIDKSAIQWCSAYLTRRHPHFRFHRVEARHQRYSPDAPQMDDTFRLPFDDQTFDIVYLHSVFANMEPNDVKVYAREFHRLLKAGGKIFLTAFIEDDVPPVTINPEDYLIKIAGPLHVARYEREYFLSLLKSAGLELLHFAHGADLGGQSVVHLQRPLVAA